MGYSPHHRSVAPRPRNEISGAACLQRPPRFRFIDQWFGHIFAGFAADGTLHGINHPEFCLLAGAPYIQTIGFGVPTPKTSLAVRSVLQTIAPLFHFCGKAADPPGTPFGTL